MEHIQHAVTSVGWLSGVAALALLVGGGIGDVADGRIDGPTALSPFTTGVREPCPNGWAYASDTVNDTVLLRCVRAPWVVVLDPDGGFDYGLDTSDPDGEKIDDPLAVPSWNE